MRLKNFSQLLALCFALALQPAAAQTRRDARDSSVTIIFGDGSSKSSTSEKKKKASSGQNNIIKIAPLGFISGQFPLLYERRLTDVFTVQVGGGLTHRNYIRSAFMSVLNSEGEAALIKEYPWSSSSSDYDVAAPAYNFDHRQPEMGYMYRIEPRIYFGGDAPEESYLGFQYNHARYNFSIPGLVNGEYKGDKKNEFESLTDFMVHFGHQYLYDRISMEWSSAIGLRQIKGNKYVMSNKGQEGFASYSKSIVNFGIGFSVGYHF
ncbi:MAG: DUF3575 domain-containing protein [Chitinophagaceae bacterium]|nr:MAG: DUF3575 domain-containing protein [Chitinophagaceae bacterium]